MNMTPRTQAPSDRYKKLVKNMSGHEPKNFRNAEYIRKREEKMMRKAHQSNKQYKEAMSSYLLEDENYAGFSNQLASIGLQLRDIPGDGNCLFRALADQLDGNSGNHQQYREEVVKHMINHRSDFEPFVEDDCSFDDHVYKLRQDGTYAGNDAIVAFARKYGVNVVIHQLNAPMWTINGNERGNVPQLHISYHNGDHYSSVRKLNDNSCSPASVKLTTKSENKQQSSLKRDPRRKQLSSATLLKKKIQHISNMTGCQDAKLIQQLLEDNDNDEELATLIIQQTMTSPEDSDESPHVSNYKAQSSNNSKTFSHPKLWESNGTGSRLFGNQNLSNKQDTKKKTVPPAKKLSNKNRKEQARKERKKRSEEKKKNTPSPNLGLSDSDDSEIILKNMAILKM